MADFYRSAHNSNLSGHIVHAFLIAACMHEAGWFGWGIHKLRGQLCGKAGG